MVHFQKNWRVELLSERETNMHTINFTGTSGQVLKLLLTDEKYQASLDRAGNFNPQKLREVVGDPNLNNDDREQLNG